MDREISKTPDTPNHLSQKLQILLTELCFDGDALDQPVDLLFVYGTPYFIEDIAAHISTLLHKGLANTVLIAGGMMPHGEPFLQQKSEARLIYEKLNPDNFNHINFFLEEKSQNALENVSESLKILDFRDYKNIGFVFSSHAARRGYLTLRKCSPMSNLFQAPYDASYLEEGGKITKDNWHTFNFGIKRVWGEFLRIRHYGQRGDIAYNGEIKHLIEMIDEAAVGVGQSAC